MEISGTMSLAAQEMMNNNAQAGLDVLTKTLTKTELGEQSELDGRSLSEQTGKGLYIDIKA